MSTVNDYAENSHDPLCVKYISGDDLPCICDLLAEHAQIIRADERERIAQEIQVIHIPDLSDYGPTGAANWMRYEAWRIARGGES